MILKYYYDNPYIPPKKLCTEICADYKNLSVSIKNYTDNLLYRAFGINEHPSWAQYEDFLRSRCLPETRYNIKDVLEDYGLSNVGYDPLEIVRVTHGRMAEDHMCLEIA